MSEISPAQARKAALVSQGIHLEHRLGRGKNATLKVIEKLGYIQVDTISVVERAHHHTLWSRALGYQKSHLEQLRADGDVFEYWSHAAAYLPMRDYRFSLPRKQAIRRGEKHWYEVEPELLSAVLKRVRDEGPMQSRDFEHTRKGAGGWWEWKPAKRALEQLFMRGELMIARREGFQKVYDLTERVVPAKTDTSMPTQEEFLDHLILGYLAAHGVGSPSQMAYLRKGIKPQITQRCRELAEDGSLIALKLNKADYFALANLEEILLTPLSQKKIKILSPFDNLLIQRDRTRDLFAFDYQIECYVPEKKRRFGYFVLPILWGHKFAGRMDAKIDRKSKVMTVKKLYIETKQEKEFLAALLPVLEQFCVFNGGEQFTIAQQTSL